MEEHGTKHDGLIIGWAQLLNVKAASVVRGVIVSNESTKWHSDVIAIRIVGKVELEGIVCNVGHRF